MSSYRSSFVDVAEYASMVFLYAETMQTRDYHMECPDTLKTIEDQFFSR